MKDPFEREAAVFDTARQLAPADRAAYLDQACAGDAALRQRIERLLQASEQAGAFLQEPAPGAERAQGAEAASTLTLNTAARGEKAGDRIGHYKLLQQIGEGGCGLVYMAEQEEPVRRRVALKVIKLGMDTKSVIARFEAERQALAMMDHPNIAKVFEAGATETGRPYFVMELVRGIKITDYCDEHNLSTKERLELFIQVCNAVQHAHQKGIIHRDLKPSNILVASNDGVPVPKVIDFGIAKTTTGQHLTDNTVFTAFEQFIGTPAYMSPEQAELTMQDVDTRTDIYSLGVLLYELLTSRTPFDAKELLACGLDAMRRTIREQEPQRPSTRLSTMLADELTTTAKHRHTEGVKLIHLLRGDLDWIVMKCLEKDRQRRYESVNGLGADLERYLRDEVVEARPPSAFYRLQRVARRHRFAFAASAAIALTLVLGVIVSMWQAVRATRAEHQQRWLREEAQEAQIQEASQRRRAEELRGTAEIALYQARLNENHALRIGLPQGWSKLAFRNLSSNAAMNLPERDRVELRQEAALCMEELDVRKVAELEGHSMEVWALDFSLDSALLASADYGGVSIVWQVATREVLREFKDPAAGSVRRYTSFAPFPSIRFNPRGGEVALTTWRHSVEALGLMNQADAILRLTSHANAKYLDYDRFGNVIAVAWTDNCVGAYDTVSGNLIREVDGIGGMVATAPDGRAMATVGAEETILLQSLTTADPPVVLGQHRKVRRLTFSPLGNLLASASEDHSVRIYDVKEARELFTLLGHKARVHNAVFRNDGRLVVTVSDDRTARLWDIHTGQTVLTIRPETGEPILAAAFSPDGR
jgi:serine/threonine protein kinase